ncbi:Y-family DNA polymerase [Acuticoccus mangrovi]|uniref:DNA-directed DNA polymerase n=1 Tax=Acuticoccus mangrovi TaxID=2796142 RepID=A0A934ISE7_9HYPH|nr:DNA polymerase Y family protein [Acuticoccus mangrovi]MBJ3777921.1 DNA polymerase Y family protein [Acuticoccus mangrovi]
MSGADGRARRVMHVWLPSLATDRLSIERVRELRRQRSGAAFSELLAQVRAEPLATVMPASGGRSIDALNESARAAGLSVGLSLADARAQFPELQSDPSDPVADQETLVAIGRAVDRYTPFVGLAPPSGLFLDISGCAHLFGGEEALRADILKRLSAWGYEVKAAIADSPAVAWAVARHGEMGIIPPRQSREAVASLPVEALRIAPDMASMLRRLGLKTVDAVLCQPRRPLLERLGPWLTRRIDQIEERESEPITPLTPTAPFVAEHNFADPIAHLEAIEGALRHLAERLSRALEQRGEGARRLLLRLFHADGAVREVRVGASRPLADPDRIRELLAPRLAMLSARIEADSGIDLIRLHAEETGPLDPEQGDFQQEKVAFADIARLVDVLSERLGADAVQCFVPVDTHQPGKAYLRRPAREWLEKGRREAGSQPMPASLASERLPPLRPIKVFTPPEPMETLASVPDGPPIRFTWRRVSYHVAAAEGPERIAPPWWEGGETCDYYRVEDIEGHRFWIFRQGLYGEAQQPRWFMHGLFA